MPLRGCHNVTLSKKLLSTRIVTLLQRCNNREPDDTLRHCEQTAELLQPYAHSKTSFFLFLSYFVGEFALKRIVESCAKNLLLHLRIKRFVFSR